MSAYKEQKTKKQKQNATEQAEYIKFIYSKTCLGLTQPLSQFVSSINNSRSSNPSFETMVGARIRIANSNARGIRSRANNHPHQPRSNCTLWRTTRVAICRFGSCVPSSHKWQKTFALTHNCPTLKALCVRCAVA